MRLFENILMFLMFVAGCIAIAGVGLLCDCPLFSGPTPEVQAYTLMMFGGLGMFAVIAGIICVRDNRETRKILERLRRIEA